MAREDLTPAEKQLYDDDYTSKPVEGIYRESCYICRDPDYAQMGLPLCRACPVCGGHVPADDSVCENDHDELEQMAAYEARKAS